MAIDTKSLTDIITEFCALQSKDAVSPESLGYILQRIVDLLSTAGTSETVTKIQTLLDGFNAAGQAITAISQGRCSALTIIINTKTMRKINKIIIHCSATPEGRDYTVGQIRQWHVLDYGWRDIGYHFVIYRDGSVHEGRPIEEIGSHCKGYNANSIGICYIGGCAADAETPKDTRTEAQRAALIRLVAELKARHPHATVHGHNELTCKRAQSQACLSYAECSRQCTECEFANKVCPSFNVQKEPELCGR